VDFCSNPASAVLILINPATQAGYQELLEGLGKVHIDFAGVVAIEAVIAVNFAVREDKARGNTEEVDATVPDGQVGVVFFVFAVNVEEIFKADPPQLKRLLGTQEVKRFHVKEGI